MIINASSMRHVAMRCYEDMRWLVRFSSAAIGTAQETSICMLTKMFKEGSPVLLARAKHAKAVAETKTSPTHDTQALPLL